MSINNQVYHTTDIANEQMQEGLLRLLKPF